MNLNKRKISMSLAFVLILLIVTQFVFVTEVGSDVNPMIKYASSLEGAKENLKNENNVEKIEVLNDDILIKFVEDTYFVMEKDGQYFSRQGFYTIKKDTNEIVFCLRPELVANEIDGEVSLKEGHEYISLNSNEKEELLSIIKETLFKYNETKDESYLVAGQLLVWEVKGSQIIETDAKTETKINEIKSAANYAVNEEEFLYVDTSGQDLINYEGDFNDHVIDDQTSSNPQDDDQNGEQDDENIINENKRNLELGFGANSIESVNTNYADAKLKVISKDTITDAQIILKKDGQKSSVKYVLDQEELAELNDTKVLSFKVSNLEPNTVYDVVLVENETSYDYGELYTDYEPLIGSIKAQDTTTDSIKYSYEFEDTKNILKGLKLVIKDGDSVVVEQELSMAENEVVINGLKPGTKYTASLYFRSFVNNEVYSLDTNQYLVASTDDTTISKEKAIPEAKIYGHASQVGYNDINVVYDLIDNDAALVGDATLMIYDRFDSVVETIAIKPGINQSHKFDKLNSNTNYTVKIYGDYDVNNDGIIDNGDDNVLSYHEFSTKEITLKEPQAMIYDETEVGYTDINVHYSIKDEDKTLYDGANLLIENDLGTVVDSVDVIAGDSLVHKFTSLDDDSKYVVKIVGKYDLTGDALPENKEPYILYKKEFTTKKLIKETPTGHIHALDEEVASTVGITDINVKYDLVDSDSAITSDPVVNLYNEDGTQLIDSNIAELGISNDSYFSSLEGSTKYVAKLEADYILQEDVISGVLSEYTFTTNKNIPTAYVHTEDDVVATTVGDKDINVIYDFNDINSAVINKPIISVYDKNNLIESKPAVIGNNSSVHFSNLEPEKEYTVKVEAEYDLINQEKSFNILGEQTFTTDKELKVAPKGYIHRIDVENPSVVGENNIDVVYDLTDLDGAFMDTPKLKLYRGEKVVREVDAINGNRNYNFNLLKRNTEYNVKLEGFYDMNNDGDADNDGIIAQQVFTTSKSAPKGYIHTQDDLIGTTIGANDINVIYDLEDVDQTLDEDYYISIYKEGLDVPEISNKAELGADSYQYFEKLSPETNYIVKLEGFYDINNDGNPDNKDKTIAQSTFRTQKALKEVPVAKIHDVNGEYNSTVGYDNVNLVYDLTDNDNALMNGTKLNIYKNGKVISQKEKDVIVGMNQTNAYKNLSADTEYVFQIEGSYDINSDGVADNQNKILNSVALTTNTDIKAAPTAILNKKDYEITSKQATIVLDFIDIDNTLVNGAVNLYEGDVLVGTQSIQKGLNREYLFTRLKSDQEYTVKVEYDYDLNGDGQTTSAVVFDTFKTDKVAPVGTIGNEYGINNTVVTDNSIDVKYEISDINNAIVGDINMVLYDGDTAIFTKPVRNNKGNILFDGLESGHEYLVKIEGDYDINSDGIIDSNQIVEKTFATKLTQGTGLIHDNDHTTNPSKVYENSINVFYDLEDPDNVLPEMYLSLYDANGILLEKVSASKGTNQSHEFSKLTSNSQYFIVLEDHYNNIVSSYVTFTTDNTSPTASIYDYNDTIITADKISGFYDLTDIDNALLNDAKINIRDENNLLVDSLIIETGIKSSYSFGSLVSATEYTISIEGNYDLNHDGNADNTSSKLAERKFTTKAQKSSPIVKINDISGSNPSVVSKESISVSYMLNDIDSAIMGNSKLIIKEESTGTEVDTIAYETGNSFNTYLFDNLKPSTTYEIEIQGYYDLNSDGIEDNYSNKVLASNSFTTDSLGAPSAIIHSTTNNACNSVEAYKKIKVCYDFIDEDSTAIDPRLVISNSGWSDDVSVSAGTNLAYVFDNLMEDEVYSVKVESHIDLNRDDQPDNATKTVLYESTFTTRNEKTVPTLKLDMGNITDNDAQIIYSITDIDNAIVGQPTIKIVDGESKNANIATNQTTTFYELDPYTAYDVILEVEYQTHEGITKQISTTETFKTENEQINEPTFNIELTAGIGSVDVDYNYYDVDNVLKNPKLKITESGTTSHKEIAIISSTELESYKFEDLKQGTLYDVQITDGINSSSTEQIETLSENPAPNVTFSNDVITEDKVSIGYDISNSEHVISKKAELYSGDVLIDSKDINNSGTVEFNNLIENTSYEIKINGKYESGIGEKPFSSSKLFSTNNEVENLITTCEQFNQIGTGNYNLDESYELQNNIVCNETIEGDFTGTFDGNEHEITGTNILFESNSGTISNLNVKGTNLASSNNGTISKVYISDGSVADTNNGIISSSGAHVAYTSGINIGGLVGTNNSSGTIENSYSKGSIIGTDNVGGLVGTNAGNVVDSYSTVNVSGDDNVGGLIGVNSGDVKRTYSIGSVAGIGNIGGLIGISSGIVSDSFTNSIVIGTGSGTVGVVIGNGSGSNLYYYNNSCKNCNTVDVNEVSASQLASDTWYTSELCFGGEWSFSDNFYPQIRNSDLSGEVKYQETTSTPSKSQELGNKVIRAIVNMWK